MLRQCHPIWFAIAILASACGRAHVGSTSTELRLQGEVLLFKNKAFTGVVEEHFPNGTVYRETEYRDGLKDGFEHKFGLNGKLTDRLNYVHGKEEGLQEGWFVEGPKRYEYHMKNGLFDGVETQWHISGTVFRREVFHQGELADKKVLYSDGSVFSNFSKRDGRIYGIDRGSLCMETKRPEEK
jgi:antitoxin component YwqK of YwqJK toxin-antitoxin module